MKLGCGNLVVNRIVSFYERLSGTRLEWHGKGLHSRAAAVRAIRYALAKGYRYEEFLGVMHQLQQQHGVGWPWSWMIAGLPVYRAESTQGCSYFVQEE